MSKKTQSRRINITMPGHLHEEFMEFAEEQGMSFSEFIRRSCQDQQHRMTEDQVAREDRPLLHELERIQNRIDELSELRQQMSDIEEIFDEYIVPNNLSNEAISKKILSLRQKQKSTWTLAEWAKELDLSLDEVQRGQSHLESQFAIVRISNGPESTDRWKFLGSTKDE